MALAYLTINLDAFTGDDHPPVPSYSTITLDPGADHIDAANDVIHVRTIVVSLDRQGKAASANGVPCVDGKVPVVAGVAYAVSAPNVLRGGPHYVPALTAGQVVDLSDYITPGAPLTPDQAAALAARVTILEATPPGSGVTDHGALTGLGDDDHPQYLTTGRGDARYVQGTDPRLSDARTPTAHASTHAAAGSDPVTLTAAQLSDLTETVQDIVAALIVAGTNVTATYNDAAGTFTINASTGTVTDPEVVRDVIGAAMVAGSGVQITVNDAGDTITIASTAVLPTRQVIAGTGLTGGGDLSADRTLTVAYGTAAGTAAQGNDSRLSDARTPTAHTHGIADLTATGTPSATTYLRGDGTWATPAGGGGGSGPLTGTGFPEGVIAAPVGTEYVDTAATNGAIKWIKTAGTGNTGWVCVEGDTGWRVVTHSGLSTGSIRLRRINSTVYVFPGGGTWGIFALTESPAGYPVPSGFRISLWTSLARMVKDADKTDAGHVQIDQGNSSVVLFYPTVPAGTNVLLTSALTYVTSDPWPTNLPGTPA